ncbi:hypothetical protein NPIL_423521 [Nephila pilipes]|uniref:Uncharacterized protein n=1 Tax=Nephila pilipes TaxID=299642 RepID=A0A8X6QPS5_NEPPI|nr:hypothetical protein NPIL_423521 [Nephila pilipes]
MPPTKSRRHLKYLAKAIKTSMPHNNRSLAAPQNIAFRLCRSSIYTIKYYNACCLTSFLPPIKPLLAFFAVNLYSKTAGLIYTLQYWPRAAALCAKP